MMAGGHMDRRGLHIHIIIWIHIPEEGRTFMGKMRMRRMRGVRGAVLSVLLRCVDGSLRGQIVISKMRMRMRKMMVHHRRLLDSNLQSHFFFPPLLCFLFPPSTHLFLFSPPFSFCPITITFILSCYFYQ